MTKMEVTRERLERDAYEVDPGKVADAILQRLLAGSTVRPKLS